MWLPDAWLYSFLTVAVADVSGAFTKWPVHIHSERTVWLTNDQSERLDGLKRGLVVYDLHDARSGEGAPQSSSDDFGLDIQPDVLLLLTDEHRAWPGAIEHDRVLREKAIN